MAGRRARHHGPYAAPDVPKPPTKRPGNIARRLADLKRRLLDNVWLGATCGRQKSFSMLKPLLRGSARRHFLSCEPLLTALPDLKLDGIGLGHRRRPERFPRRAVRSRLDARLARLVHRQRRGIFLKEWGTWASNPTPHHLELADPKTTKGGATLDGRLWREYPMTTL
jgi:protein gp37